MLLLQLVLVLVSLRTVSVNCVSCSSSKCCGCDAWRKCHVVVFFIVFSWVLHRMFCFDINVLVAGDLRHEYAQSTWGFPFRGPPGYWLHLSRLCHGNWHSFDNDCCRGMSIVVMSSRRLCPVHWQGRLLVLRLIATALLVALEGRLSHERFVASQWWRWSYPSNQWWLCLCPLRLATAALPVVACCNCA